MADDKQDISQSEDPAAGDSIPYRLSDRVALVEDDSEVIGPVDMSSSVPLHQMHDSRMVRPAGRMILGSRAAAPIPIDASNAIVEHPQLFSSAKEGRPRLSGGAVVAVVCAIAVGATAALTAVVNKGGGQGRQGEAVQNQPAAYSAEEPPRAAPAAPGTTQVAALSTASLPRPIETGGSDLTRVATQDSPGLSIDNITGPAGTPLPVKVQITLANSEEYSFLMFRGLPDAISLSAGFRLKDSWAVSLRDVQKLTLISPAAFQGAFNLEVLLVKGRNTPVESRIVTVSLGDVAPGTPGTIVASVAPEPAPASRILTAAAPEAEAAPQPAPPLAVAPPPAPAPSIPPKLTITPEAESSMLERAGRLLGTGDVASARLLFEHVAKKGSGKAALALAQTYDPAFLRSINAVGLKPDREKAKEWYGIAMQLGQEAARERLTALAGR